MQSDPDGDVFPAEHTPRRRVPAGHALLVVLVTLALTVVLDADGLVRTAERQPRGWQRSTALAVLHPIQDVSGALRLNRPRQWVAEASGHHDEVHITPTKDVKVAPLHPQGTAEHDPKASSTTTTTTTTLPNYRTPTAADPLRVLVAGDSLSGQLGPALGSALGGMPAKVSVDEEVGTGLARPDVVDWPSRLTGEMAQQRPEVVVLIFGGNDNQDLRTAQGWIYISHFDEWKLEYQRRIAQIMNIVAQPGVSVYWVGLPVMDRAKLQAVVPTINQLIQAEAAARPQSVHYVDPNQVLANPDGSYAVYLPDGHGGQVRVREGDGVHPTRAGADRIASQLVDLFAVPRHLR